MLGFAPAVIDDLSFWELAACVDGYNRANGGGESEKGKLTSSEESALWDLVQGGIT